MKIKCQHCSAMMHLPEVTTPGGMKTKLFTALLVYISFIFMVWMTVSGLAFVQIATDINEQTYLKKVEVIMADKFLDEAKKFNDSLSTIPEEPMFEPEEDIEL